MAENPDWEKCLGRNVASIIRGYQTGDITAPLGGEFYSQGDPPQCAAGQPGRWAINIRWQVWPEDEDG